MLLKQRNRTIKKGRSGKVVSAWLLLIPAVVILYLMVWRPSVFGIVWSFFKMNGYNPDKFVGLDNYIRVITNSDFPKVMRNTVQYVLLSFVIGFVPPVIIAFILNEMMHARKLLRTVIYLPAVLPGVTILLLWYFIYSPSETGLLNMILARFGMEPYGWLNDSRFTILYIIIEMTWAGFPGAMFLYYTSLQGIDNTLYEAALLDGAGPVKRFRYVALPQMAGMLVLNVIRQIIGVFQVLQEPMVLTGGGPNGASTSVGYQMYQYGFVTGRVGESLALGTITFLILIVFTCFYFYVNKKVEDNM